MASYEVSLTDENKNLIGLCQELSVCTGKPVKFL